MRDTSIFAGAKPASNKERGEHSRRNGRNSFR